MRISLGIGLYRKMNKYELIFIYPLIRCKFTEVFRNNVNLFDIGNSFQRNHTETNNVSMQSNKWFRINVLDND